MKKYLIYGLVISLVIAGLLGIGALTSGRFDELQIRTLITTLAFVVYCLIGLCCNSIIGSEYSIVGKLGLVVAVFGLLYAVITTWATPHIIGFLQFRFGVLVVGLCFAHCSLLLLVRTYNSVIAAVRAIAISASIVVTIISLVMIFMISGHTFLLQLLGVFLIIGVISTIVVPIMAFTAGNE